MILRNAKITTTLVAAALLLSGCNYSGNLSGIHWFLDMHDAHSIKAFQDDPLTLNLSKEESGLMRGADSLQVWTGPGAAMRVPPEGTVPRGYEPYPYTQDEANLASAELVNTLPRTAEVVARGQKQYDIHCAVCHGHTGIGDGPVTPMYPTPPSLITGPSAQWSDGMVYHLITMGRGQMRPYAAQIESADRWAIVHYVKLLQKR